MKFIVYHANDFGKHKEEVEISSLEDLKKLQDSQGVDRKGDHCSLIINFYERFETPDSTCGHRRYLDPQPAIMFYDGFIE